MGKMLSKQKRILKDCFQKKTGTNFTSKLSITEENIAKQETVMVYLVIYAPLVILIEKSL